MSNDNKKYHYIYITTCKVTDKRYIGIHSTNDLDDGYMGSGVLLKDSIKKHGAANHVREILEFADNREMLSEIERGVVNIEMLKDPKYLNLKLGGDGGYMSSDEVQEIARVKKRKNRYLEKKTLKRKKRNEKYLNHVNRPRVNPSKNQTNQSSAKPRVLRLVSASKRIF